MANQLLSGIQDSNFLRPCFLSTLRLYIFSDLFQAAQQYFISEIEFYMLYFLFYFISSFLLQQLSKTMKPSWTMLMLCWGTQCHCLVKFPLTLQILSKLFHGLWKSTGGRRSTCHQVLHMVDNPMHIYINGKGTLHKYKYIKITNLLNK